MSPREILSGCTHTFQAPVRCPGESERTTLRAKDI